MTRAAADEAWSRASTPRAGPGADHPRALSQWLGLKVVAVHDDGIEIKATWREEWMVNRSAAIPMAASWRRWSISPPTGRWCADRPRRADHRHAGRLSRPPCPATSRARQGRPLGWPVLDRRGADLRPPGQALASGRGTYSPRRPQRRRHERHEPDFTNLGDLIRRDRDLQARDHRSRRRESAARVQLRAARRHGERRRARARSSAACARRPRRHPVGQSRRISRRLFRHHARRPGRGAGQFRFPRETIDFILRDAGAQARVLRRAAPPDARRTCRASLRRARSNAFLDPGPFEAVAPRPTSRQCSSTPRARPAAEGRRAVAPEPHLGGRDAARGRARRAIAI